MCGKKFLASLSQRNKTDLDHVCMWDVHLSELLDEIVGGFFGAIEHEHKALKAYTHSMRLGQ